MYYEFKQIVLLEQNLILLKKKLNDLLQKMGDIEIQNSQHSSQITQDEENIIVKIENDNDEIKKKDEKAINSTQNKLNLIQIQKIQNKEPIQKEQLRKKIQQIQQLKKFIIKNFLMYRQSKDYLNNKINFIYQFLPYGFQYQIKKQFIKPLDQKLLMVEKLDFNKNNLKNQHYFLILEQIFNQSLVNICKFSLKNKIYVFKSPIYKQRNLIIQQDNSNTYQNFCIYLRENHLVLHLIFKIFSIKNQTNKNISQEMLQLNNVSFCSIQDHQLHMEQLQNFGILNQNQYYQIQQLQYEDQSQENLDFQFIQRIIKYPLFKSQFQILNKITIFLQNEYFNKKLDNFKIERILFDICENYSKLFSQDLCSICQKYLKINFYTKSIDPPFLIFQNKLVHEKCFKNFSK